MEIDKNIPVPPQRKYKGPDGGVSKYPFWEMEKGDSVFYEDENEGRAAASRSRTMNQVGERKFVARKVPTGGIRIWRVS